MSGRVHGADISQRIVPARRLGPASHGCHGWPGEDRVGYCIGWRVQGALETCPTSTPETINRIRTARRARWRACSRVCRRSTCSWCRAGRTHGSPASRAGTVHLTDSSERDRCIAPVSLSHGGSPAAPGLGGLGRRTAGGSGQAQVDPVYWRRLQPGDDIIISSPRLIIVSSSRRLQPE